MAYIVRVCLFFRTFVLETKNKQIKMKRMRLLVLLALAFMGVGGAMAQRSVETLDFGWLFHAGDVENG